MLRVLVLVSVTACVVSGALLPPSIEESYNIVPEEVPNIDWSISTTGHAENAQAFADDVSGAYGHGSSTIGSYTVSESAVTAIAYGDVAAGDSNTPGRYTVTEYAMVGSYGEGDSNAADGGRRLLDVGGPATAPAASSTPQTVLLIDVPDDFNPEDNSLVLSFYAVWAHRSSSSFNAAFALELLNRENTEILSFEGPTLHHRSVRSTQPRQQRKPFVLHYTTAFDDVLLTPGEQAVLRLSTEGSVFTDFSATVDLTWRQESSPGAVTPDQHGTRQKGHYATGTVSSSRPVTKLQTRSKPVPMVAKVPAEYAETQLQHHIDTIAGNEPAFKLVKRHRQLLEVATLGAYGLGQRDMYGAITEAAGPGTYGGQLHGLDDAVIEAAGAGTYGGEQSNLYNTVREAAGPGAYGGEQSDVYGAITEAAEPGSYGWQRPVLDDVVSEAAGPGTYNGRQHSQRTPGGSNTIAGSERPNNIPSRGVRYTNSEDSDNMQTAMSALLGQRPVPWSYHTAAVGDARVPAAVLKPSPPGPIQAPDAPIRPAVQPGPISAPVTELTTAVAPAAVQEPGQPHAPQPVDAVLMQDDAFASDGSGCTIRIPRGLQCGGAGGLCAQHTGAPSGFACKDEPYDDACCASGTVCTRKNEEWWVCAPKLPLAGHGLGRRLLA